jgi:hypothetical protein
VPFSGSSARASTSAHFVNRADRYGNDVAQQAREDNPQLTPGQLGTIASNATAWYGNSAVQRNLLASARKVGYSGREGLHRLPDRDGGLNGGLIGFRRAGETSGGKTPAVDLKTPELGDVKIHFVP